MEPADFQIQPSEYYAQKGHLYVNTPYGQGVLVGMKDAFAQVRLRWGGLMSIAQSKITPHQSHLNATCPDRAPDMTDVRDTKRHLVDCGTATTKRRRED